MMLVFLLFLLYNERMNIKGDIVMQILVSIATVIVMILTSFVNGLFVKTPSDLAPVDPDTAYEADLSAADVLFLEGLHASELAWLAYTQLDNGAIPMTGNKNGDVTVNPYFADVAALALLTDAEKYGMILRAKGIVESVDGRFIHFDYVPGEPDIRYGSAALVGRLCVIGAGIDREKIKELFGI